MTADEKEIKENYLFSDLHIHSRFSRACSKALTIPNLVKWARIKGLNLLGTGDFSHPVWLQELKETLKEEEGVFWYEDSVGSFPFILSSEISLVYTDNNKGRRVHLVYLAPSFEVVDKINQYLDTKGRRDYDGRPIFKISCRDFVADMQNIDDKIEVIPAHCLLPDSMIHTNHSIKKIKDIKKGDLVLTHNNRWKKVTDIFIRNYNGKIYKIRPWYFTEGLKTTSEHPYYAIKSYKCSWIKGLCKKDCSKLSWCKNQRFEKYLLEWVPASELKPGDFLVYPRFTKILDRNKFKEIKITSDFFRLLGYFLAEGYLIRQEGIGFSFNKNEKDYISDVINLIKDIFGKEEFKIDDRNKGNIIFYSKFINIFFSQFYNSKIHRGHTKALKEFMLELPLKKQVEIFRGWYRGNKGYTVSRELMNQMKIICLRLGIIPNISADKVEKHKKRGKHFIGKREIIANYDLYSLGNLSFFEYKFNLLQEDIFKKFKTKISRRHGWMDKNYIYIPIRKIEIDDYKGEVYNLEVKEDNSYVSEFACVHNCWTPWFGVFGSKGGYNSLDEAFKDKRERIHAIETGISSTPIMNWKLKDLENISIISFSDSHSFWPFRLGREATIFKLEKTEKLSYDLILKQIRGNSFIGTIETDPAYGKYHFDGHSNCGFSCGFEKTKELNGICPKCNKPLIIGVDYRVEELASEDADYKDKKKYYTILPLHEILSLGLGVGMNAKKTWDIYNKLIERFENEFNILLDVSEKELIRVLDNRLLVDLIIKNRGGKIRVIPGFDGQYGRAVIDPKADEGIEKDSERQNKAVEKQNKVVEKQTRLF